MTLIVMSGNLLNLSPEVFLCCVILIDPYQTFSFSFKRSVAMEAAQGLLAWLLCCLRPVIKGFLRVTTRLCELQRVCYGERAGAPRTMAVGMYHVADKF